METPLQTCSNGSNFVNTLLFHQLHHCLQRNIFLIPKLFRHEHWILPGMLQSHPVSPNKNEGHKATDQVFKTRNWFWPSHTLNCILLRLFLWYKPYSTGKDCALHTIHCFFEAPETPTYKAEGKGRVSVRSFPVRVSMGSCQPVPGLAPGYVSSPLHLSFRWSSFLSVKRTIIQG